MAAWWLGQAGWVLKGRSATVVLDAFLSPALYSEHGCLHPPPFDPAACDIADLVLGTHIHADHIDPDCFPTLLEASAGAVGIVPAAIRDQVLALGVAPERLCGAVAEQELVEHGVRILPQPALHGDTMDAGYGFHLDSEGRHPFLGFLLELDGVRIYHAGDTLVYPGLAERLRGLDLDLLLLPINGTSWFREQRGLVGNMNSFEAAELAELSGARLTIPMHWDLFPDNGEDPRHFTEFAAARHPGAQVRVATRLERFEVLPTGGP